MIQTTENRRNPSNAKQPRRRLFESDLATDLAIRFSPTAWAKLLYFRDRQKTEIGGFGVTSADDLLMVEDFITVRQDVSVVSVSFDDEAVADFFDGQVDAGNKPEQFARIWLHTHPGDSPVPSATDEETFERVFGGCDWAVMCILAKDGQAYARLRFNVGPGGEMSIPVEVDYSQPFGPSDHEAWEAEFKTNIKTVMSRNPERSIFGYWDDWDEDLLAASCPNGWLEELEAMEPEERRLIISKLTSRPDLLEESETFDVE